MCRSPEMRAESAPMSAPSGRERKTTEPGQTSMSSVCEGGAERECSDLSATHGRGLTGSDGACTCGRVARIGDGAQVHVL